MAETDNISKMAEKVSKEIFSIFGWKRVGPVNKNWECGAKDEHKTGPGTHPSDVVFSYDDPYVNQSIYVTVDLKSYSSASISTAKIGGALNSLAKSTECANQSEEFSTHYVADIGATRWNAVGLLFIYNHDREFHRGFDEFLNLVDESNFKIATDRQLFIFGPKQISYLYNMAHDLVFLRGQANSGTGQYRFHYPDFINHKTRNGREVDVASLEWLTSPWQVVLNGPETIVYVEESKATSDDYKYLIDYLFRFQLVEKTRTIRVRQIRASSQTTIDAALFGKAIDEYVNAAHPFAQGEFKARLSTLKFETVALSITMFDETEIGMRND